MNVSHPCLYSLGLPCLCSSDVVYRQSCVELASLLRDSGIVWTTLMRSSSNGRIQGEHPIKSYLLFALDQTGQSRLLDITSAGRCPFIMFTSFGSRAEWFLSLSRVTFTKASFKERPCLALSLFLSVVHDGQFERIPPLFRSPDSGAAATLANYFAEILGLSKS